MSITEKTNKDGTVTFHMTAYDGYKIDSKGHYVQARKYRSFRQPQDMGIREARKIAKELDLEFQRQFERDQNTGVEMRLEEVWNWYKNYYAPNKLRDTPFIILKTW